MRARTEHPTLKRTWVSLASDSHHTLYDGARIAVVGGGPAGSMFSYFLTKMARTVSLQLAIDIYEPRFFSHRGPAGCNHCGGVISESLLQKLATEGIDLPADVVQRGMDSYTLHMDVGTVRIDAPGLESRIAAVYRGNGPRESEPTTNISFDGYLQTLATDSGARLVRRLVTGVQRKDDRVSVICADGQRDDYDLLVVATGVNTHFLEALGMPTTEIREPARTKTFITEFRMGREQIQRTLGDSMHVFLLDIPRLVFAALVPKGEFVTMCMLGDDIDEALIEDFMGSREFRHCFPDGVVPPHVCHCFPRINVGTARYTFDDRIVLVGDSGTSRIYKDGIGAAYRTAKAAARTAVFHGVSARDFEQHYWPLCQRIEADNRLGKMIFSISRRLQKMPFARRGILRMTALEQEARRDHKRMSEILWDIFSGSAPYRDICLRAMHPAYLGGLVWNLAASNLSPAARAATGRSGQRPERPAMRRPH